MTHRGGNGFETALKSAPVTVADATARLHAPVLHTFTIFSAGFHADAEPNAVEPVTRMSFAFAFANSSVAAQAVTGSLVANVKFVVCGPVRWIERDLERKAEVGTDHDRVAGRRSGDGELRVR